MVLILLLRSFIFLTFAVLACSRTNRADGDAGGVPEPNVLFGFNASIFEEIIQKVKTMPRNSAVQLKEKMLKAVEAIDQLLLVQEDISKMNRPKVVKPISEIFPQPSECGVDPDPYPGTSNLPLGHRKKIAKEGNVSLKYFEAGFAGNVSSVDPRVFGPDAWRTLHRFSIHYPVNPNRETVIACERFMSGLPYMIPCPHCGYHLREFIVLNEQYDGDNRAECRGNCTSAEKICSAQAIMVGFFARAHNNVNYYNYPLRPAWTATDVYKEYADPSVPGPIRPYGPGPTPWVTQGPIDGKCQLIRAIGTNTSGSPDFLKHGDQENVLSNVKACAMQ